MADDNPARDLSIGEIVGPSIRVPDMSGVTEFLDAQREHRERLDDAALSTPDLLGVLVREAKAAEEREAVMLRWTRVSALAATAAAVLSVVAIVLALLLRP